MPQEIKNFHLFFKKKIKNYITFAATNAMHTVDVEENAANNGFLTTL